MSARRTPDDDARTGVFDRGAAREQPTMPALPRSVAHARGEPAAPARRPVELASPTEVSAPPDRSEPLRVVSMKSAAERARPAEPRRIAPNPRPDVVIRALSEVTPMPGADLPELGRLAPPRDPRRARTRKLREVVVLAGAVLAIGGVVALAIWLLARA